MRLDFVRQWLQKQSSQGKGQEMYECGGGDRQRLLRDFQVNDAVMAAAKTDAIFMHCLPVYREQEATAAVVDGAQSVIWQEAENRLHVQKAIMAHCFGV